MMNGADATKGKLKEIFVSDKEANPISELGFAKPKEKNKVLKATLSSPISSPCFRLGIPYG